MWGGLSECASVGGRINEFFRWFCSDGHVIFDSLLISAVVQGLFGLTLLGPRDSLFTKKLIGWSILRSHLLRSILIKYGKLLDTARRKGLLRYLITSLTGAEFCKANHMARKGNDWTTSTLAWDLLAQYHNPGTKLQQPLIFRNEQNSVQGMRYIRRPTRKEIVKRELHVKQLEGYTHMDHKGAHFRSIFFKPAVWIKAVTVFAEKFRIAVEDPWIYA